MTVRDLLRTLPVFDRPLPAFDTGDLPGEPMSLFAAWLGEAAAAVVIEPHVMTLSTVDAQGCPDSRVVILRDADDAGWRFTTSAASPAGTQLAANPQAALGFYWREQGRQVRARGPVTAAGPAASAADFLAGPDGARIAGLVGRQSAVLPDPGLLPREFEAARRRLAADPLAVAEDHAVYLLNPSEVEFWQGDHRRQHTRLRYRRSGRGWITERLWP